MQNQNEHHKKEIDQVSGVETTGHEWDGLKELNNPAPRWWLWVWLVTFIWALGYWVVYPAWPTISGHTKGVWEWTEYKALELSQKEIAVRQEKYLEQFRKTPLSEIQKSDELHKFAMTGGKIAFKENCAMCHGSGGEGRTGIPNLNDDDWLWGGTVDDIYQTIKVGIRSPHPEARQSQMPAFGKDGLLTKEQIEQVVSHVLSLSGKGEPNVAGAEVFANNCASCHGTNGEGGRDFGAPRLNDAIWLYGGDHEAVFETVWNARAGVMPTWESRLPDETIKQLTIYVHDLGGGE